METMKTSVLFVCTGNTCRSPMAEACLREIIHSNKVEDEWCVDSAGVAASVGAVPSSGGMSCMKTHGLFHHVQNHRSQQVTNKHFNNFNYILAMDSENMRRLKEIAPQGSFNAQLLMLGSFDDDQSCGGIIDDPFGASAEVFEDAYQKISRSCQNFFKQNSA